MKRSACGLDIMADIILDLTCVLWLEQRRKPIQESLKLPGSRKTEAINSGRARGHRSICKRRVGLTDQPAILDVDEKTLVPEVGRAQDGTRNVGDPEPVQR